MAFCFDISNFVLRFLIILIIKIYSFLGQPTCISCCISEEAKNKDINYRVSFTHFEIFCNKYCGLRRGAERVIGSPDPVE